MPRIAITSIDDDRLAPYCRLKESNAFRREGLFVAEGEKLTRRLLASDFEVASLLVGESWAEAFPEASADTPLLVVPDDWVEQIIGFNFHRGVLACGRRRRSPTVEEICQGADGRLTVVVCPDVQDPENLGTILRTASAFGIQGVVLGKRTADPFSRRVLRVSMGASLRIPVAHSLDLPVDLGRMKANWQIERWATVLDADATPLAGLARPERLALLFGSEGHGLERELVAECDRQITIPMAPGVDSLNVAVAAGIFLHAVHWR